MGSITVLLGRSRWRRRRALPERAWSGIDPLGRPTFLYIAASTAKRRVVEREFVAFRADTPCFAPTVRVLDELVDDLWARHGDGRALLPRRAAEHVAAELIEEHRDVWPWLGRIGGSGSGGTLAVARSLLDLRDALDRAGQLDSGHGVGDVPHRDELIRALTALERRLRGVPGHVPRTLACRALLERLHRPSRPLVRQLRAARTVVIDDLLQLSPLDRALLVSLCRAWASVGTHVVLSFETGRDLGGREVGLFFEYDDVDEVAYALRPFHATRGLRRTVFEELVATGEAELALALRDGVVEIEPGAPLFDPAPADLSDHLYGPRPIQVDGAPLADPAQVAALFGDTVCLHRYPDPAAELLGVARRVKQALLAGTAPTDCVIAVPDLATRAGAVRAALEDHGVPFLLARSGALAATPVATVALNVATLAVRGFPADQVLALATSDLVAVAPEEEAALPLTELARICSRAGVPDGPPRTWLPALRSWLDRQVYRAGSPAQDLFRALEALDDLVTPLEILARPATPGVWRERLLRQLRRLGTPQQAGSGALPGRALDAWGALHDLLDGLARDLEIAGARDLAPEVLADRFADALGRTPVPPPRRQGGQVEVVDLDDLLGLTPRHLWVAGLTRGAWPGSPPPAFLVPERRLAELQVPRRAHAARYLFASLLRNALDDREIARLELSWPAITDGRPTSPSPLVEDLLALPTRIPDGRGGYKLLADAIDLEPPLDERPHGRTAALTLAAREPAWRALVPEVGTGPGAGHGDPADLARQAVIHRERTAPVPGAFEGVLERPPAETPQELAVTGLETYLKCPARFWYQRLLDLSALEPVAPEVPPHRKGSVLHAILEAFLQPRLGRPIAGDPAALRRELHQTALQRLDELSKEGGFSAVLLDHLRDEWLAGLVDQRPAGVLRVWLEAELRAGRTPVAVEQAQSIQLDGLLLKAQLDRVDRTPHGSLVLDYKTGRAPRPQDVSAGLVLQPIAYAAARAEQAPGRPVAAGFVTLGRADAVRETGFVGEAAVLDDVRASRRSSLELTAAEREALLTHARESAARLRRGVAHTTLATPNQAGCRHCDFRRICRLDADRAAVLAASPADLQRPLLPDDEDDDAEGAA